nr:cytochrome c oxidase assembly protein [Sediminibacillus albus]
MAMNNLHHGAGLTHQLLLALPFIMAIILYISAVLLSLQRQRPWHWHRSVFWIAGCLSAIAAVSGPLARRAVFDFEAHMAGHLLLGMLAPLLMVLGAPVTLMLRTLRPRSARRLSRLLRSWPVRVISDPLFASILNVGGLWLLYTTNLYSAMHGSNPLHALIHLHVFLAGYVFTAAIIYIDPTPHRASFVYRSGALIAALAAHGMLSKYIYAHPPAGVSAIQAESGGMLMYYGGDAVDVILICILCYQWYKRCRPRIPLSVSKPEGFPQN